MNDHVPRVKPRTVAEIRRRAEELASHFSPETLRGERPFPIQEFCESSAMRRIYGISFAVDNLPPLQEGRLEGGELVLSASVYAALCAGDRRARFTLAHELGHAVLHAEELRVINERQHEVALYRRGELKAFIDPEWQASEFAAALLMPERAVVHMATSCPNDFLLSLAIVNKLDVSKTAAVTRIARLRRRGVLPLA